MSAFSVKRPPKSYKELDHQKYVARITKTLYYSSLPNNDKLSLPVTELAAELFSEAQYGKSLERLHLNTASNISRNACVSPCSLIIAMLYLEKLKTRNPEYLERTSPSDLFLVSLMISMQQLAQLEREFLKAIDWEVHVKEVAFWRRLDKLEMQLADREGNRRGYFTYTELSNLADLIEVYALVQCVFTMTMILVASYTAGVLIIAGSFHLVSYVPGNAFQVKSIEHVANEVKLNDTLLENDSMRYLEGLEQKLNEKTSVEPVHILRTSLFLASINTLMSPYCNVSDGATDSEVESACWEWWKLPSMIWLSESSQEYNMNEHMSFNYFYNCFIGYLEILSVSSSNLEVGNHINMNKATMTRIQDQLEGSWHKEWTDSLQEEIFNSPYI
ncbi:hypothetical protein WA026_012155 [Henosepilachna vigintioctopunctata]|uniref:Protein CNPPD1 n=1 Tax=Henosepilachna vigintioctopunctata TaxID=420089 RepID=A0AAW1VCQ5_9CUCU